MHIGSGGAQVSLEGMNPMTEIAAAFAYAARSSVNLMVSPLLRRYPDAKVVWSEGGIGWIPAAIERADRQWERHQYWTHIENAHIKPSEVARTKHVLLHDRGAGRHQVPARLPGRPDPVGVRLSTRRHPVPQDPVVGEGGLRRNSSGRDRPHHAQERRRSSSTSRSRRSSSPHTAEPARRTARHSASCTGGGL